MNTREYLIAKGHSPEAIVCNDWNQINSDFDLEEMLEDYHQTKLKNSSQHLVSKSLPTDEETEIQAEKALFGFGKGRQYDDDYRTGYEHGAKWIRGQSNVC